MTTVLAFLFVLGVLIFVHELGHFLVARWYGVRVLTFSLGFGPKVLKFTRGGTEYCLSIIPLGGYVKLAGETVQDDRTGAPDEFMSKSKWVRFQVYLAGPVMNILLAIVALTVSLAGGADVPRYTSAAPVIGTIDADSAAAKAGVRLGDRIVSVNGVNTPTWDALTLAILPKANRELTMVIDRAGEKTEIRAVPTSETKYEFGSLGVGPILRPQIVQVNPRTPAERAGFRRGDVLLSMDGQRGLDRDRLVSYIKSRGPQPIVVGIERDGQAMDLTVTPQGSVGSSIIGVSIYPYEVQHVDPTLAQAFNLSLKQNWDNATLIGRTLRGLFTRETNVKQLMGPVAIAELSGSAAALGWLKLFELMAMISLNLGLINLMPVPIMDGGQIAILAVEGATRRDISMRVKERILMAGAALVVLLMVTVIYNDVARLMR